MEVRSVDRERLPRVIANSLVQMIASKELSPGDRLPSESELAERFNVSKPTVRQALNHLAAFGVVKIQQGKPSTIEPLNAQPLEIYFELAVRATDNGLRDALAFRRVIETGVAEMAAQRAEKSSIRLLESAFYEMEATASDPDRWVTSDLAFHAALARCTGNELIEHAVAGLAGVMRFTIRLVAVQVDLRNVASSLARHEAILTAVSQGDSEAARAAMANHFDATSDVVDAIAHDNSRLARI